MIWREWRMWYCIRITTEELVSTCHRPATMRWNIHPPVNRWFEGLRRTYWRGMRNQWRPRMSSLVQRTSKENHGFATEIPTSRNSAEKNVAEGQLNIFSLLRNFKNILKWFKQLITFKELQSCWSIVEKRKYSFRCISLQVGLRYQLRVPIQQSGRSGKKGFADNPGVKMLKKFHHRLDQWSSYNNYLHSTLQNNGTMKY